MTVDHLFEFLGSLFPALADTDTLLIIAILVPLLALFGIIAVNAAYLNMDSEIPESIIDYMSENEGLETVNKGA